MAQESPFVLEGDRIMREGEGRTFAIVFPQFSTMSTASSGCEVYVNGSTDTANFVAGSTTITGNVVTTPTITIPSGFGGLTVVIEQQVLVDSIPYKEAIVINVLKPGAAA